MSRAQHDGYAYVRQYYGVPAYVGVRVTAGGRAGVLTPNKRGDQYLYILLDGDQKPRGPYHPTDDIVYQPVGEEIA